jgi:hypothetical protein
MVKSELVKDLRVTGHAVIAEICLVYLLELNGPPTDELKTSHPLAEFAARYWPVHAAAAGEAFENVHKLAMALFSSQL